MRKFRLYIGRKGDMKEMTLTPFTPDKCKTTLTEDQKVTADAILQLMTAAAAE